MKETEWQTVTYKKVKKSSVVQKGKESEPLYVREEHEALPEPLHYKCKKYEYA